MADEEGDEDVDRFSLLYNQDILPPPDVENSPYVKKLKRQLQELVEKKVPKII